MICVVLYMFGCFLVILYCTVQMQMSQRQVHVDLTLHKEWHPTTREKRFPSVEQRVHLYMSPSWYSPPCGTDGSSSLLSLREEVRPSNYTVAHVSVGAAAGGAETLRFDGVMDRNRWLYLHKELIQDCARNPLGMMIDRVLWPRIYPTEKYVWNRRLMRGYCKISLLLLHKLEDQQRMFDGTDSSKKKTQMPPLLGYIGYDIPSISIPVLGMSRPAIVDPVWLNQLRSKDKQLTPKEDDCASTRPMGPPSPILLLNDKQQILDRIKLASRRDTPWEKKRFGAIWRGLHAWDGFKGKLEQEPRKCQENPICAFVLNVNQAKGDVVNVGYDVSAGFGDQVVDGIALTRPSVGMRTLQQNKILFHLENSSSMFDNAALAWKLHSRSVVIMEPPTRTTWLMEELLEPWVHYVPMNATIDVHERIQWVRDHDEEACKIAERSSLWIQDLLFHEQSVLDDDKVQRNILQRYRRYWQI